AVDPEVGAFKPNARGYVAAAVRWGIPPANVLYVGDRLDVDAPGAISAGMPCAILTRAVPVGNGVIAVRDFRELQSVIERVC
nr:HAD family hydrolase [Acidobacteriota bacterium]